MPLHLNGLFHLVFNRNLQIKLDQPVSAPPSPRDTNSGDSAPTNSTPEQLTSHIQWLRNEVSRLKHQLTLSLQERKCVLNYYRNYNVLIRAVHESILSWILQNT